MNDLDHPFKPGESANQTAQGVQLTADQLIAIVEKSFQKDLDDPGNFVIPLITGVIATLLAAAMLAAVAQVWQHLNTRFWRAVGWLGGLPGFSRLALRAYLRSLEERHGKLVNIYLGITEVLTLRRVFVPLTLRATDHKVLETSPRSTRQILTDPLQKRLVLLGSPGSGKSTLLKALATGVSRREWVDFKDLVPILLPLRSYGPVSDQRSLMDWLAQTHLPGYGLRNTAALLESLLSQGRILLLLDGLDEVAGDKLDRVNRRISEFLHQHDTSQCRCRVMLTCREQNYDAQPDREHYVREGFNIYRATELRDSEIEEIVMRRAEQFSERGKSREHYLKQVYLHPGIAQLHRNPLLLTLSMGVYLHGPGEEVPQNLAGFYEQSIDNLLRRWNFRESREISANRFNAEDKFRFLRYFARDSLLKATEAGQDFEEFDYTALTDFAAELARQGKLAIAVEQADDLVREIHRQAGLLSALRDPLDDRKDGLFVFAHRSLHEYCAAAGFLKQGDQGFHEIQAQLGNPAWRQVIFFYCAMDHGNAQRLVQTSFDQACHNGDLELLALAGHSAAVMAEPHPQLRLIMLDRISQALLAAESTQRPYLLKSLLALGNSRGEEIRARLELALRQFIAVAEPTQITQEISRVEPALALEFLHFLAAGADPERKTQALRGSEQIEGIIKIPLLWRLWLELQTSSQGVNALEQLLVLMAEPGAVERLNQCQPQPPANLEPSREQIQQLYPFLKPNQPPSHFARLLVWTKRNTAAWSWLNDQPTIDSDLDARQGFRQFLQMVLSEKDREQHQDWRHLPQDRRRWTPKIATLTLGRLLWGLPLGLGAILTVIAIWDLGLEKNDWSTLFILLLILAALCGLVFGLLWLGWRWQLSRWRLQGQLQTYPAPWCRCLAQSVPVTGWLRRIGHGVKRSLQIVTATSISFVLLGLSLFLHNPRIHGNSGPIFALAVDGKGTGRLLTGSYDDTARLWDASTGTELQRFKHEGSVYHVAYAPDGKSVLTGSDDNTARLWDASTGTELQRFKHDYHVNDVAYAPDGKSVLTGSSDAAARLWDAATGTELQRFKHEGSVYHVAYAPDGKSVLTGSSDDTARLWDASTGTELRRFKHDYRVNDVAYAPDGKSVLTGSSDAAARLWDAATGTELQRFKHDDDVIEVAYAPDGKSVLTGSDDNTARLWDAATGTELQRFKHDDDHVNDVAYASDGKSVYVATGYSIDTYDTKTGEMSGKIFTIPYWDIKSWNSWSIVYLWLTLVFVSWFLPALKWFDPGRVIYLRKPNRYLHLYQIPQIERWLPPEP